MLIVDQLNKNDPQLRAVAIALLLGLGVLAAGLWWVQIVSKKDYQAHLEMQSYRTVRVPAVRGKILDRNGIVLAENRATYNVSLYLEELRKDFDSAYVKKLTSAKADINRRIEAEQHRLGRKLNAKDKKAFGLSTEYKAGLREAARYEVASNVVMEISRRLGQPQVLNSTNFQRHYKTRLALPLPIATNLNAVQIAIYSEQCTAPMGADLEFQSTRVYPFTNTAAHVLGWLQRDERSKEGEDSFFSYRLPDYQGQLGIEFACDKQLRGKAAVETVEVNNVGYRQRVNVWQPAEPGNNVVLTLDLRVQQKAEHALQTFGPTTRGALVVMDVQTGDIIAMASSPTVNPNDSLQPLTPAEAARRANTTLKPERNRATQERYAPGSIFKTIIGLACLEAGLDPKEEINNPGYFQSRTIRKPILDTARPGRYNFQTALIHSSNTYFIENGLKAGIENIIRLGQRLHLTEGTGLNTYQETKGQFPTLKRVDSNWGDGQTANICIGQGLMSATPLQMTVMTAAIANGGKVLWPRLVDRIEATDPVSATPQVIYEKGRVRDELGVRPENLKVLREAMLKDTGADGTGARAAVPGLDIGGKTGTAQVMNELNQTIADTVWFASFAPYANPRYAVVVMVEIERNAGSGGSICAPIAGQIYRALIERDRVASNSGQRLARAN